VTYARKGQQPEDRILREALGLGQGHEPFPWQTSLLERFLRADPPSALDIPTGLGKTAVVGASSGPSCMNGSTTSPGPEGKRG